MSWRAGYIGIIGQPNAGKSTLLNALVGDKVAIVTPKPQTTRGRVVGIVNREQTQVCFVDTPGIVRAAKGLNHFLEREARDVIQQSDGLLAVVSVTEKSLEEAEQVLDAAVASRKPWIGVISKADLGLSHRLSQLRRSIEARGAECLVVSAEREQDKVLDQVLPLLTPMLSESPGALFPLDFYTTQTVRDMSAELIRERSFEVLHQEVPFSLAVRLRRFDEGDRDVKIQADLIVARENHRPIVVGRGGQTIKSIGMVARERVSQLVGRAVHLDLRVVVKPRWHQDEHSLAELGYVLPEA